MKSSWLVPLALTLGHAFAGQPAPTSAAPDNQWQDWVTTTVYQVDTKTEYKTSVSVSVSVSYVTSYVTNYVTVTGPTTTIPGPKTTVTSYISQAPSTVISTITVTNVVPTVSVSVVQSIATVSALATVTSVRTVSNVQIVTQSALSGLVTCESRIINPTYTPPAPLPSNYLWGCPPGKLCYPPRIGCNFEQGLPADTYVCKPEDCRPVAALPPLDAYFRANRYNNNSCAFITPIDDYFNLNPLRFGLNYGIFNVFGQKTCSASTTCPAPKTVTVPQTIPVPTTLTVAKTFEVSKPVTIEITKPVTIVQPSPVTIIAEKSSSTWAVWQGSAAPPKVTKRAELSDRQLVKRQAQALLAVPDCYVYCDACAAAYQNLGKNVNDLCDPSSSYLQAYASALDCIASNPYTGGTAVSEVTELSSARQLCTAANLKRGLGRRVA